MSMNAEQLVKEILQLSIQQRAFLAEKLLESLDFNQDFQLTKEWSEEIKRRCEEIDEGLIELIPAEDVFKKAYKQL